MAASSYGRHREARLAAPPCSCDDALCFNSHMQDFVRQTEEYRASVEVAKRLGWPPRLPTTGSETQQVSVPVPI